MDVPQLLAVWLHTLALVIAWGYYGILARVIIPALRESLDRRTTLATLVVVERRAVPLVLLSMVLFTTTGIYLLVKDPHYAGLGDVFASTWTALMFVKHLFVVGFIAAGVLVDWRIRRMDAPASDPEYHSAMSRIELTAEAATGLGALIVLLTAAAQTTT